MPPNSRHDGGLGDYRAKRDPQRTPEPFGRRVEDRAPGKLGTFVVQLHAARRRHYDVRLEHRGVLVSWAVPKGPSLDPAEKHLAVRVEDHPLEYADFEGVIPEGNYGAGAVVVWDTGAWTPLEDADAGLEAGKLEFELKGYKLRGRFVLVRTGKAADAKEWLLIKKSDVFADPGRELDDRSVLSGLTVEELAQGPERSQAICAELERMGAPRGEVDARTLHPMLCQTAEAPFSHPDWLFELKYDGYRLLAARRGKGAYLRYRSGREATEWFPEIARAVAALPYESFVIDGEVVVLGDDGRPVFNRLQQRTQNHGTRDIRRAAMAHPATLAVFDLVAFAGYDLRSLPLVVRKRLLARMLPGTGPLSYADHIVARGEDMFAAVVERGVEGVVAKRADSPYLGRRSDCWLKIKVEREDDFAIVGYTSPQGSRVGFGSLHLAVRDRGQWVYAGRVGSGFGHRDLETLSQALGEVRPWTPTFAAPSSPQRDDTWVEPELVCTVKYQDWPEGSLLRFARFVRLRRDKRPEDCRRPEPTSVRGVSPAPSHADEPAGDGDGDEDEDAGPPAQPGRPARGGPREVRFSNLAKVFWPATDTHGAYTKGDLIDYYRNISPWLLPHLRGRPVVLIRYPDGIYGNSFFQKDAPAWVPGWIRTETLWSRHAEREINYFVCDDLESLLYLVNLGTIPLHIWSSRIDALTQPDWAILDLDPKGAPFADVVRVARAIGDLCRSLELRSFVKTSGQAGLHVFIPLGGACTYEQGRTLAQLLAKVIEAELPDIATTARPLARRNGKVYLDYVQNGHGRLIVAPFSVRPVPGATVSMPLRWSEVDDRLDPSRFTMDTALRRMQRLRTDPLADVLDAQVNLARALALLGRRVSAPK